MVKSKATQQLPQIAVHSGAAMPTHSGGTPRQNPASPCPMLLLVLHTLAFKPQPRTPPTAPHQSDTLHTLPSCNALHSPAHLMVAVDRDLGVGISTVTVPVLLSTSAMPITGWSPEFISPTPTPCGQAKVRSVCAGAWSARLPGACFRARAKSRS